MKKSSFYTPLTRPEISHLQLEEEVLAMVESKQDLEVESDEVSSPFPTPDYEFLSTTNCILLQIDGQLGETEL